MPRKKGRPTKLRQRVPAPTKEDPDRRLTVGELVWELMETHGTRATLCAEQAGVDRATIRSWLKHGEDALVKHDKGHLLTPDDQLHLDFLIGTRAAHAAWIHTKKKLHSDIADGGLTITEVIQEVDPTQEVTRPDGSKSPKVLKTRTKTQRLLPDPVALRWELERLAVDDEGARIFAPRVEVTGADGGPIELEDKETRAAVIAAELAAFQMGADAGKAEVERNGSSA